MSPESRNEQLGQQCCCPLNDKREYISDFWGRPQNFIFDFWGHPQNPIFDFWGRPQNFIFDFWGRPQSELRMDIITSILCMQYKHFWEGGGGLEFGETCLYNTCTLPNLITSSAYLTMRACSGVLPRESGSLINSLSPWSISNLAVCSVSSADFFPCSNNTWSAVMSWVDVLTVVVAPHWIKSSEQSWVISSYWVGGGGYLKTWYHAGCTDG